MNDDTCTFDGGCDRPVGVPKWKLCSPHYAYLHRRGLLATDAVKCSEDGCKRTVKLIRVGLCTPHVKAAREAGYLPQDCTFSHDGIPCGRPCHDDKHCRGHRQQLARGQELRVLQPKDPRVGTCPGEAGECAAPIRSRGMCSAHYYQWSRGLPLTAIDRSPSLMGEPCVTCAGYGEERRSETRDGQCESHSRRRAAGDPDWERRIQQKAPDGTGFINADGYRVLRGRLEHCALAEQLLGRPLMGTENVHHANGNRSDNRIDGPFVMDERGRLCSGNLELWSTSQPPGQQIGPKLSWSLEMLGTYGPVAAFWEADLDILRRLLGMYGDPAERKRYAALAPSVG